MTFDCLLLSIIGCLPLGPGDVPKMAVAGGRLGWATRRQPPGPDHRWPMADGGSCCAGWRRSEAPTLAGLEMERGKPLGLGEVASMRERFGKAGGAEPQRWLGEAELARLSKHEGS